MSGEKDTPLGPVLPEQKGMEPDDLLCSRNERPRKLLIGHTQ
jgi:hypothetical protein